VESGGGDVEMEVEAEVEESCSNSQFIRLVFVWRHVRVPC